MRGEVNKDHRTPCCTGDALGTDPREESCRSRSKPTKASSPSSTWDQEGFALGNEGFLTAHRRDVFLI